MRTKKERLKPGPKVPRDSRRLQLQVPLDIYEEVAGIVKVTVELYKNNFGSVVECMKLVLDRKPKR